MASAGAKFWLVSRRKQKKTCFYPNHVTSSYKIIWNELEKTLIGKIKSTHTSVSPTGWAAGRHSHTYICAHGAPATARTQTLGPKTQQPPLLYILFPLCSFRFFSLFLRCAYTHMCVKFIWNKWKYRKTERGRERTDGFKEKKKQSVGAEEEEGRVLKRQAHLPLHLHTAWEHLGRPVSLSTIRDHYSVFKDTNDVNKQNVWLCTH